MKASNFFEMSNDELNLKLNELKEELFNLRFKHKAGQLENANQLAVCKERYRKSKDGYPSKRTRYFSRTGKSR